jgi:hypothetical protein
MTEPKPAKDIEPAIVDLLIDDATRYPERTLRQF